jgi:hypothetical protein
VRITARNFGSIERRSCVQSAKPNHDVSSPCEYKDVPGACSDLDPQPKNAMTQSSQAGMEEKDRAEKREEIQGRTRGCYEEREI